MTDIDGKPFRMLPQYGDICVIGLMSTYDAPLLRQVQAVIRLAGIVCALALVASLLGCRGQPNWQRSGRTSSWVFDEWQWGAISMTASQAEAEWHNKALPELRSLCNDTGDLEVNASSTLEEKYFAEKRYALAFQHCSRVLAAAEGDTLHRQTGGRIGLGEIYVSYLAALGGEEDWLTRRLDASASRPNGERDFLLRLDLDFARGDYAAVLERASAFSGCEAHASTWFFVDLIRIQALLKLKRYDVAYDVFLECDLPRVVLERDMGREAQTVIVHYLEIGVEAALEAGVVADARVYAQAIEDALVRQKDVSLRSPIQRMRRLIPAAARSEPSTCPACP